MLSTFSKRQCGFPLFKQFLETEMTLSQPIIVRECIFKNQSLYFASRLRVNSLYSACNCNCNAFRR